MEYFEKIIAGYINIFESKEFPLEHIQNLHVSMPMEYLQRRAEETMCHTATSFYGWMSPLLKDMVLDILKDERKEIADALQYFCKNSEEREYRYYIAYKEYQTKIGYGINEKQEIKTLSGCEVVIKFFFDGINPKMDIRTVYPSF